MSPVDEPNDVVQNAIARRVRSLRKSKGWTLDQLASLSGVSRSMLSQIERGVANPTLGVAHRIAQAFGLSLGRLVEHGLPDARIDVVRANDRHSLFRDDEDCRIRTLSPLHLEKDVEFYEVRLAPHGKLVSAPHYAGTREFLTVQHGAVTLRSGDESTELAAGDSAHYAADVRHAIENSGQSDALIFLVVIYSRSASS